MDESVVCLEKSLETIDLTNDSDEEAEPQSKNSTQASVASSEISSKEKADKFKDVEFIDLSDEVVDKRQSRLSKELQENKDRFFCPICLELLSSKHVTATICGHVFCTLCIDKNFSLRKLCPVCNRALFRSDLIKLHFI